MKSKYSLPKEILEQIDRHLDNDEIISAIKIFKDYTKTDLKFSKAVIEEYQKQRLNKLNSQNDTSRPQHSTNYYQKKPSSTNTTRSSNTGMSDRTSRRPDSDYAYSKRNSYQTFQNDDIGFYEDKSDNIRSLIITLLTCIFLAYIVYTLFLSN